MFLMTAADTRIFFSAAHRLNCDLDISIIYCKNLLNPHLLQLYYDIETVNCKLFPFTHLLFMEHKLKKNDIDALEQTKFEKMTCFQRIHLNNFSHLHALSITQY